MSLNEVSVGASGNPTNISAAPGEEHIYADNFLASLLMPYMKAQLLVSSTRYVTRYPNSFLGFIPLGYVEENIPMHAIATVAANMRFRFGRFVLGVLTGLAGVVGVFINLDFRFFPFLILSGLFLLAAFPIMLVVVTNSGFVNVVTVSVLERKRMEIFRAEMQQRLFADQELLRHREAQEFRAQQLQVQQMMLQQQQLQQMQQTLDNQAATEN